MHIFLPFNSFIWLFVERYKDWRQHGLIAGINLVFIAIALYLESHDAQTLEIPQSVIKAKKPQNKAKLRLNLKKDFD